MGYPKRITVRKIIITLAIIVATITIANADTFEDALRVDTEAVRHANEVNRLVDEARKLADESDRLFWKGIMLVTTDEEESLRILGEASRLDAEVRQIMKAAQHHVDEGRKLADKAERLFEEADSNPRWGIRCLAMSRELC